MRLDRSFPSSCRIAAIICLLLFFPCTSLFSQTESYRLEQIPYKGELSYFRGLCIMEDKEGFMWFGSKNGLYRYDGNEFKVFRHDPFDPWSISSDYIMVFFEDSANIWYATPQGFGRYEKYTEQFYTCHTQTIWLNTMIGDSSGNIWLCTQTGSLLKYEKGSEIIDTMVSSDLKQLHTGRGFNSLLMDRFGVLWIRSYDFQLYTFDTKTDSLVKIEYAPCRLFSVFEDRSGRLWVTGETGLYLLNREKEVFERQLYKAGDQNSLDDGLVGYVIEDRSGNLWIRTCEGIYKYSQDLSLLFKLDDPLDCSGRIGYSPRLFEDQSGTIWFFNKNGINQLVREYENFTLFNPDPPSSQVNSLVSLINDDSLIYGSLSDFYYTYNRKNELLKKHKLHPVYAVCTDSRGVFWLGTSHGLFRMVESDSQIPEYIGYQPVAGDSSSLPGIHINYIFEDSGGRLWIGSRGAGPCYYDRVNDCFIHLVDDPNNPVKLTYETSIRHETDQGELLALNSGVFKVIPPFIKISDHAVVASELIEFVSPNPTGQQLSHFYASMIDHRGTLWLGCSSMGLFSRTEEGLRSYSVRDGLLSNVINTIQEDSKGSLWLGTGAGLSKFDPQSESFTNFVKFNGRILGWFRKSSARNFRGELFFCTHEGLLSFFPDSIRISSGVPGVRLTGFRVFNKEITPSDSSILKKSIQFTDSVSLSHKQNTVTVSFAVLSFIQPEKNQYKYMLEGLEEDWVFSGKRNSITYANLLPGNYVFRASGSNAEGIWNEEGASLSIYIAKPPWRMWWAYLCYVVFLSGIAVMTWRFLVGRARMKTALELEKVELEKVLEMDQMKSRFFANISHEFRTPLTLILGPIEDGLKSGSSKVETERKVFKMMRRNAKRLLRLINQLLDMSRLETGMMRVHVSGGDLRVFTRTIASSFLSLAESKGITYSIELPESESVCFFDSDKVEKILTNMLSNALKYTPKGKSVTLQMEYQRSSDGSLIKSVLFRVTDRGRGIAKDRIAKVFERFHSIESSEKKEDESMGLGLAHTRELVHLLKGTVELESEIGKGTIITVILPVAESDFSTKERVVENDRGEQVLKDDRKEKSPSTEKAGSEVVLIVEDNQDLRTYISQHLEREFKTIEAVNGQEGFISAIDAIPDLVISDIMMPVKSGIELCRELKNDPRTSHIPVILLTAKANRVSKLEGLDSGADDYMIKPFDSTELLTRVRNLIIQRKKLRLKFMQKFGPGSAEKALISPQDQLLQKIMDILQKNISEPEFKADDLSGELYMSKRQLYRKVNAVTGYSPNELMRQLRLKYAVSLFDSGEDNIARVMYEVGFNNPSYFTKCFREQYQVNPSAYIKSKTS